MVPTPSRSAVDELVTMFDHVLEESGFGWDHWHSLLWNLHNVRDDEWDRAPVEGHRTIRQLVLHIGDGFLSYASHAFGDRSYQWASHVVHDVSPGETSAEVIAWIRLAHRELHEHIATLTDDELSVLRSAPWGEQYETRRLIELQIQHAIYHTGEINHLRALLQGNDEPGNDDIGREASN